MNDITDPLSAPSTENSQTAGKSCFVIMPFGIKQDIDFDKIYASVFRPVMDAFGLMGVRSDEVSKAGLIHKDMIERIIMSDIVIVDITTLNANVFYELGIRHTACRSGTILVRRAGSSIPFNIGGMLVFDYDESSPESIATSCSLLETSIRSSLQDNNTDSLVHTLIPGLNVTRRSHVLQERKTHEWLVADGKKTIGYITGDLGNIDFVDAWVNPENTKMQMARAYEDSVSAIIRFYGAKRNVTGQVIRDIIVRQLEKRMRTASSAEPGTVIHTGSGALAHTHGVKLIFHVAAMYGEPGKGFLPIRNHSRCVSSVLKYTDKINQRFWSRNKVHSILFPLFGSRTSGIDRQDVADAFVNAAKEYFECSPHTEIKRVYFLAYTDADRNSCEIALSRARLIKKLDN